MIAARRGSGTVHGIVVAAADCSDRAAWYPHERSGHTAPPEPPMIGSCASTAAAAAALIVLSPVAALAQEGRGLPTCPAILTDQASCHFAAVDLPASMSSAVPGRLRTIENITPAATNPTRICWLGHYTGRANAAAADETFSIRIFPDTGLGFPNLSNGPVFERTFRQSGTWGVDMLEMSCLDGQFCPGTSSPATGGLWVYSAQVLDGFTMTANGCYWIEIACAGSAQQGVDWFWSASSAGNDLGSYRETNGNYTHFSFIDNDRAVCVSGGVNPLIGNCISQPSKGFCFLYESIGQPHDGLTTAGEASSSLDSPPAPGFTPVLWAENLEFPADVTVSGLCIDGFWSCAGAPCDAPAVPVFELAYWNDAGGIPGEVIAIFQTGGPGVTIDGDGTAWTAIRHPPVSIQGGDCHWISIGYRRDASDPGRLWNWRRTTAPQIGDGLVASYQDGLWTRRILADDGGSAAASHFTIGLNATVFPQRPGCTDCNANGTPDAFEIAATPTLDCYTPPTPAGPGGPDGVLDRCQCIGNWDRSAAVNSADISAFLSSWLAAVQGDPRIVDPDCSGSTNSSDISYFLARWLDAVTLLDPLANCP